MAVCPAQFMFFPQFFFRNITEEDLLIEPVLEPI